MRSSSWLLPSPEAPRDRTRSSSALGHAMQRMTVGVLFPGPLFLLGVAVIVGVALLISNRMSKR